MATTTLVLIRVDKNVKADATKTLAAIGASDAVRMLLVRVATEKALSIEVKVPDASTVKAGGGLRRSKALRECRRSV
jgi:DNA-damage-inducible protein J